MFLNILLPIKLQNHLQSKHLINLDRYARIPRATSSETSSGRAHASETEILEGNFMGGTVCGDGGRRVVQEMVIS